MRPQAIKTLTRIAAGALALAFGLNANAGAPAIVEQVKSFREGDVFTAELQLKGEITAPEVAVQFNNESVQIDLPQTALAKNKQLIRLEDKIVKSVYVHQPDSGMVRAKITLKPGFLAKSLDERVRVRRKAGGIAIEVSGDAATGTAAKNEPELQRLVTVLDENAAEDPSGLPAKLVAGGEKPAQGTESASSGEPATAAAGATGAVAVAEEQKKQEMQKLPENQIPVLATVKEEKKEAGGQFHRIMITLGVLTVLFGAASFGLKRWANRAGHRSGKNQNTKIKILTQHHLGAKKSLAIIQVAGESLLIGITDQNISMLKTLSLIDDEIPEEVPRNFGGAMADFIEDDEEEVESPRSARGRKGDRRREPVEDFAMRGLSEIRDVVSTRLRGMKNLE